MKVQTGPVLIIAPHPDDESLGCGGTLLKLKGNGLEVHWMVVARITEKNGYDREQTADQESVIQSVGKKFGFKKIHSLDCPPAKLETLDRASLVEQFGKVIREVRPTMLFLPFPGDVHTDHKVVFDVAMACTKWFRFDTIKRVLAYETLSETEFGIDPTSFGFRPNSFCDISEYLAQKLEILSLYADQLGPFPFPRSLEAVSSLARLRGAASGNQAAESFMLLKEVF